MLATTLSTITLLSLPLGTIASSGFFDPRNFEEDLNLPAFHIVPYPYNWSNDPNGPMYDPVHDKYHLFYQYQTPRVWGHVVSDDLINWKQLPVAISNDNWYDAEGVYSGSATILGDEEQTPVLSISSSDNTEIFLAVPKNRTDPDLIEWVLPDSNPIFVTDARDPTEMMKTSDGSLRMLTGTSEGSEIWECDGCDGQLEKVLDKENWSKLGVAHEKAESESYWECPDLFLLPPSEDDDEGKDGEDRVFVSKYSPVGWTGDHYFTGTYDEATFQFTPFDVESKMYDSNTAFYASKTFLDNRDSNKPRRVLWGWMVMWGPWEHSEGGWTGIQGVPRVVEADPTGREVLNYPIPELDLLRIESSKVAVSNFEGDKAYNTLKGIDGKDFNGRFADVVMTFGGQGSGENCTVLFQFDGISTTDGVLAVSIPENTKTARVLSDSYIIEAFFDGGKSTLSQQKEITKAEQSRIAFSRECKFEKVEAWEMKPMEFLVAESSHIFFYVVACFVAAVITVFLLCVAKAKATNENSSTKVTKGKVYHLVTF